MTTGRPTGEHLLAELTAAAIAAGVGIEDFVRPLWPFHTKWKVEQLRIARHPRHATVAKVRGFIDGSFVPPPAPVTQPNQGVPRQHRQALGLPPSERELIERSALERLAEEREREAVRKQAAATAHGSRRPGETLAEAVRREAQAIAVRREAAGVAGGGSRCSLASIEAGEDDEDTGAARAALQHRAEREYATPSALIRRATREWPDKCRKVAAMATVLGVQQGEAWLRVIDAGLRAVEQEG